MKTTSGMNKYTIQQNKTKRYIELNICITFVIIII